MAVSTAFSVEPIELQKGLFAGRRARYVTTTLPRARAGDVPITAANCKLNTAIGCVPGITDGADVISAGTSTRRTAS
jgi:hypothetical protein